ncbi:hypothetical protein V6N13_007641 [Hibiscus sabdariffa]|uniref:Uncharacterized protein n=1 Tax=Hibiscus sabdariffa TaxID=183260 RepID=A0ABR2EN20_9ROSI
MAERGYEFRFGEEFWVIRSTALTVVDWWWLMGTELDDDGPMKVWTVVTVIGNGNNGIRMGCESCDGRRDELRSNSVSVDGMASS